MQEAHGNESVVIKFLRGRAILAAVAHLHDPDPFPWLGRRSGETLLEEGERLLWSAMQGSVGGFNKVCKDMLRESRRRKKELGF